MASQIRTVLSLRLYDPAPEAMIFPSGCQLTLLTSSLCPDENSHKALKKRIH